jgi:hypothetical protein
MESIAEVRSQIAEVKIHPYQIVIPEDLISFSAKEIRSFGAKEIRCFAHSG